jgi:hypothetical protein
MARTALTEQSISLVGAAVTAGVTADPTNDHVFTPTAPLNEYIFRFTNTDSSARVATIVAGDNPPALSAGLGNLDISVPATTGDLWVGPLESARFMQSDGTILIDLAASYAGVISVYKLLRTR